MKNIVIFIVCLFPRSRPKNMVLKVFGFEIAKNCHFSPNIVWNVSRFSVEECAEIRAFNVFRNVGIEVGEGAIIGSFNWFSSAPALRHLSNFSGIFKIGSHGAINSRNYFDCSGGIEFGKFSDLAGVRSILISHQLDYTNSKQSCEGIVIGDYCLISANVKMTPGVRVENACLVAMSSVLTRGVYKSGNLYAGVPAKLKKPISGAFFERKIGKIR
jgi:acetyltransferase-like isoleucine patch superfamily enzyme